MDINESFFEFALMIERLVKNGWKLDIDYGRQSWGISTKLIATKGERKEYCYDVNCVEDLLREIDNEVFTTKECGTDKI